MSEHNPDTQLLADQLSQAYAEVLLEHVPILDSAVYEAAWYRVAERAKEYADEQQPHRHVWPDWGTRQCVHCGEPQSEAAR